MLVNKVCAALLLAVCRTLYNYISLDLFPLKK